MRNLLCVVSERSCAFWRRDGRPTETLG